MPSDERFILGVLIAIIVIWITTVFWRWLYGPKKAKLSFLAYSVPPKGQAVDLLKQEGYTVLHGKHKVPIKMIVDSQDDDALYSQLFIDYFAQKGDEIYAVRLSRERSPLRWSGSAIRDHLLPLFLIYEEVAGVLYVDVIHQKVKKITFILEDEGDMRGTT